MIKFDERVKEMPSTVSLTSPTQKLQLQTPIDLRQSMRGVLKIYLNHCLNNCLNLVVLYLQCRMKIVSDQLYVSYGVIMKLCMTKIRIKLFLSLNRHLR